jgi:hypothetical protein
MISSRYAMMLLSHRHPDACVVLNLRPPEISTSSGMRMSLAKTSSIPFLSHQNRWTRARISGTNSYICGHGDVHSSPCTQGRALTNHMEQFIHRFRAQMFVLLSHGPLWQMSRDDLFKFLLSRGVSRGVKCGVILIPQYM